MRHPRGKLGISKRKVNMALRRASILGDDLGRVVRTSLDKGVELDALIKLHPAVRKVLIAWAADGENVSSRNKLLIDLITEELITMGVIEPGEVTA